MKNIVDYPVDPLRIEFKYGRPASPRRPLGSAVDRGRARPGCVTPAGHPMSLRPSSRMLAHSLACARHFDKVPLGPSTGCSEIAVLHYPSCGVSAEMSERPIQRTETRAGTSLIVTPKAPLSVTLVTISEHPEGKSPAGVPAPTSARQQNAVLQRLPCHI